MSDLKAGTSKKFPDNATATSSETKSEERQAYSIYQRHIPPLLLVLIYTLQLVPLKLNSNFWRVGTSMVSCIQ